ncbi:flippase [Poseidonibacter ostreae]|uniref:Oligosaccharide flippase family protein n=1 Tax=Poseidonibacter ostreae TaxID=2654171 RepID=A0ABQ6VQ41_9BACT|nr:flippase [Poseidonibacter ostreae]KAB7892662.1 oligosaccharide flippase family protein [Poseidonibacter ostreae]
MKYFKNTSWLFGEKILRMVVGLFVGVWVARYLGPEQFGLFSYAQSFVGLFTAIATLGLDGIVVRELVKNESRTDELIGTAFWLKVIGAIVVLLILAIAINFTSNDIYTNALVFIIASATIFQSFNVVDLYFQSKVLSKYVVYTNVFSLLLTSIVKVILILNEAPLIAFAWVILFDSFILACGFIYFYIKNNSEFKIQNLKFKREMAVSLLKDSWPLILSGIVISIYMKIDQVMIKEMMNTEAVGQYAAAVRISELWYFIPMVIASSLFPAILNAKKQSKELYYSRLQKLYDMMVWMAIAIALPMTFLSDWVVEVLYGEQYNQSGPVLMIHIWTAVFVFLGVAFGRFLTAENLTKKSFYRTLLGAALNIILNYILIPTHGINGAAVATLLAQITANYIYDFFDKDLHQQLKMKTKSFFPIHILKGYK